MIARASGAEDGGELPRIIEAPPANGKRLWAMEAQHRVTLAREHVPGPRAPRDDLQRSVDVRLERLVPRDEPDADLRAVQRDPGAERRERLRGRREAGEELLPAAEQGERGLAARRAG